MDYSKNIFIVKNTNNELLCLQTHTDTQHTVHSGWLTFAFFVRTIDLRDR